MFSIGRAVFQVLCVSYIIQPSELWAPSFTGPFSQVRLLWEAWKHSHHIHKIIEVPLEPRSIQAQLLFLSLSSINVENFSMSFTMPSRKHGVSETKLENECWWEKCPELPPAKWAWDALQKEDMCVSSSCCTKVTWHWRTWEKFNTILECGLPAGNS